MSSTLAALVAVISALAFLITAAVSVLTYRKTMQTHKIADSNRRMSNDLVTKLAYMQGRQDAIIGFMKGDRNAFADLLGPSTS